MSDGAVQTIVGGIVAVILALLQIWNLSRTNRNITKTDENIAKTEVVHAIVNSKSDKLWDANQEQAKLLKQQADRIAALEVILSEMRATPSLHEAVEEVPEKTAEKVMEKLEGERG